MTSGEFNAHLEALSLRQAEAAMLLRVTPRAVRKWQAGEQKVPGTVAELIFAWRALHAARIPWRPDLQSIRDNGDNQVRLHQEHALGLKEVLDRVQARGGPAAPWNVNLVEHHAKLGSMVLSFYKLANGGFSPSYYRRGDGDPDVQRDQMLIDDAIALFAAAIEKARNDRPDLDWDEAR